MVTLVLKKLYTDKLDDMTNKYNNTYYSTIKMKPVYVKSNTYINSSKEVNDKDHKFEVGDHARLSKHKNIFAESYVPNWSEEHLVITKLKNTPSLANGISDLNGGEINGTFYEKELQKTNKK